MHKRARLLKLYFLVNEAYELVKKRKLERARDAYVKIKVMYRDPISPEIVNDAEKMKAEIENMYNLLVLQAQPTAPPTPPPTGTQSSEQTKEEKKPSDKKEK